MPSLTQWLCLPGKPSMFEHFCVQSSTRPTRKKYYKGDGILRQKRIPPEEFIARQSCSSRFAFAHKYRASCHLVSQSKRQRNTCWRARINAPQQQTQPSDAQTHVTAVWSWFSYLVTYYK